MPKYSVENDTLDGLQWMQFDTKKEEEKRKEF